MFIFFSLSLSLCRRFLLSAGVVRQHGDCRVTTLPKAPTPSPSLLFLMYLLFRSLLPDCPCLDPLLSSLTISFSRFCPPPPPSLSLCLCLSVSLSLCLSVSLSLCLSVSLSLSLFSLSLSLSLSLSVSPTFSLSLSVHPLVVQPENGAVPSTHKRLHPSTHKHLHVRNRNRCVNACTSYNASGAWAFLFPQAVWS